MQKPVDPETAPTSLEVEEVLHSKSATAMAVVIGR